MQSSPPKHINPSFLEAFRDLAQADTLSMADFIQLALYHPTTGYYTAHKERVGRSGTTDFYTASSIGKPFASMVLEAATSIAEKRNIASMTFVEIGCEPEKGISKHFGVSPFESTLEIPLGAEIKIPDKAVVFSNELFDAQPFQRFQFKNGTYQAIGVQWNGSSFTEVLLEGPQNDKFSHLIENFNPAPAEGYLLDWPIQAHQILESISHQSWEGVFMAFDYGLPEKVLFNDRPQGTARSYLNHTLSPDFLSTPGEKDITHHICWDSFESILADSGFSDIKTEHQEAFFIKNAQRYIQSIIENPSPAFSKDKQSLMELLHPQHMGAKFQVCYGRRFKSSNS